MITIPVKQTKIFGVNKKDKWCLLSVVIWLVVALALFFTFLATDNPVWLLIFFGGVLTIIPIFIVAYKWTNRYRGANAIFVGEVTFRAEDGELFVGDTLIPNIGFDGRKKCIYVNDTETVKSAVRGIPISVPKSSFLGIIEEPHVQEFLTFLLENGIKCKGKN